MLLSCYLSLFFHLKFFFLVEFVMGKGTLLLDRGLSYPKKNGCSKYLASKNLGTGLCDFYCQIFACSP